MAAALAKALGERGSWGLVVSLLRQAVQSLALSGPAQDAVDAEFHRAVQAVEHAAGTASSLVLVVRSQIQGSDIQSPPDEMLTSLRMLLSCFLVSVSSKIF